MRDAVLRPRLGFLLGEPMGGVESVWIRLVPELDARGWEIVPILIGQDTITTLEPAFRAAGCREVVRIRPPLDDVTGRVIGEHVLDLRLHVYVPNYTKQAHEVMRNPACPPTVMIVQGSHAEYLAEIAPFLARAAAVIVVAPNLVGVVEPQVAVEQLHLVTNGVPISVLNPDVTVYPSSVARIIHVGRLESEVKCADRYEALDDALSRSGRPYRFEIVGGGELLPAFQRRARASGGRFIAPGPIAVAAVPSLLAKSEMFVLMSDAEGMSIALLEAMAHRLVPIVSDGAVRQCGLVKDNVNGLVVGRFDPRTIANRILALGADPERRARLSAAARATAEAHGLMAMVDSYDRILRMVAGVPTRPVAGAKKP